MTRQLVSTGSRFEDEVGYSRAVVDGDWVFVAGTTGFDYDTMRIADDVESQCRRTLATITEVLAEVDCTLDDVVRVRYLVSDRDDFAPCWPLLRDAFATARPAATMMVVGLADPRMRIEVEITARRRHPPMPR